MAESKYAKTLDALKRPEPRNSAAPVRVKPSGKRSDPEWRSYNVLMKRATHDKAQFILQQKGTGQDFSDFIQELVEQWVNAHS